MFSCFCQTFVLIYICWLINQNKSWQLIKHFPPVFSQFWKCQFPVALTYWNMKGKISWSNFIPFASKFWLLLKWAKAELVSVLGICQTVRFMRLCYFFFREIAHFSDQGKMNYRKQYSENSSWRWTLHKIIGLVFVFFQKKVRGQNGGISSGGKKKRKNRGEKKKKVVLFVLQFWFSGFQTRKKNGQADRTS